MAKEIIVLETNPADGGRNNVRYVAWFRPAANRRVPRADLTASKWTGASAAEIDQLKTGEVYEEVRDLSVPTSYTTTELKAALEKDYDDRAAFLVAQPFKLQYTGVFFDSVTGWSA